MAVKKAPSMAAKKAPSYYVPVCIMGIVGDTEQIENFTKSQTIPTSPPFN